jgi:hypothetical protein
MDAPGGYVIAQDRLIAHCMHPGLRGLPDATGQRWGQSRRRKAGATRAFTIGHGRQWRESVTAMV